MTGVAGGHWVESIVTLSITVLQGLTPSVYPVHFTFMSFVSFAILECVPVCGIWTVTELEWEFTSHAPCPGIVPPVSTPRSSVYQRSGVLLPR